MNQFVAFVLEPVAHDEVTYVFKTEPWMKPIPFLAGVIGVAIVVWFVDGRRKRRR